MDRLCSSDNLGRELLEEIESVVYQAIAEEERLGAGSFTELRELRLEQVARARRAQLEDIQRYTESVAQEDQNKARLPALEKKLADLKAKIERDEKELARLLPKEKKAELARLAAVSSAIEAKTKGMQALMLQAQRQAELARDHSLLVRKWGREFEELKVRYQSCGLKDEEWTAFAPAFPQAEDVTSALATAKSRTDQTVAALRDGAAKRDDKAPATWPLKELQALQTKLSTEIGVEKERAKKHTELMRKVGTTKQARDGVQKEIEHVRGATARRQEAITGRRQAYASVFDTLVQKGEVLNELYAPLKAQLAGEADVERLELHVRRNVDVDAWVAAGEDLLDLRRSGPFQGHGSLLRVVSVGLAPAWRSGGAEEVATAMEEFINQDMGELMKARRADVTLAELGRWLFATDHVSLEYGLRYEGVDLAHLSPGMRGIVLLILYLAIDRWDTRPLLVRPAGASRGLRLARRTRRREWRRTGNGSCV